MPELPEIHNFARLVQKKGSEHVFTSIAQREGNERKWPALDPHRSFSAEGFKLTAEPRGKELQLTLTTQRSRLVKTFVFNHGLVCAPAPSRLYNILFMLLILFHFWGRRENGCGTKSLSPRSLFFSSQALAAVSSGTRVPKDGNTARTTGADAEAAFSFSFLTALWTACPWRPGTRAHSTRSSADPTRCSYVPHRLSGNGDGTCVNTIPSSGPGGLCLQDQGWTHRERLQEEHR